MADVGVVYTLTTPGPDITFNATTVPFNHRDQYYITEIRGLGSAALRIPWDPVPLGDGALIHPSYFGPRHIQIEGTILVQSTYIENSVVVIRNGMEDDLSDALNSIMSPATGTLAFTPQGESARSITVNYEVGVEYTHSANYRELQFSFGLIAASPST